MQRVSASCFLFGLLVGLIGMVSAHDPEYYYKTYGKECAMASGLSEEEFMANRYNLTDQLSSNGKCVFKCLMEKGGFFDAAGKLNTDALKDKMTFEHEAKMDRALAECKQIEHTDLCEKAFQIVRCLFRHKQAMPGR